MLCVDEKERKVIRRSFPKCAWCEWNEADSIETYLAHCLDEHLEERHD